VTDPSPVRVAGDAALLVDAPGIAPELAGAVASFVAEAGLNGVLDVVPGAETVLIVTEPGSRDLGELADLVAGLRAGLRAGLAAELAGRPAGGTGPGQAGHGQAGAGQDPAAAGQDPAAAGQIGAAGGQVGGEVEIAVTYDGADLAEVAELTGLTVAEVIARHQAADYRVGWLGFAPGFGYLTGLDPVLARVPRLATPRVSVPAGSVAIAGGLGAVYPVTSPGGWRLLGRTSAVLWDSARQPPALLAPGMRVRFRAVNEADSRAAQSRAAESRAADRPADDRSAAGQLEPERAETGRQAGRPETREQPDSAPAWTGPIEIVRPGPLATIQDLGRPGYGHLGVPRSGAADAESLRLANRLVGNDEGAAGLEFTLGRAMVRFHADAVVAVTGATTPVSIDPPVAPGGEPGSGGPDGWASDGGPGGGADDGGPGGGASDAGQAAHAGQAGRPAQARQDLTLAVTAGTVLRLGAPLGGLRTYLAISGGIGVPAVLGSRSSDLLSRLGPRPLRAGDRLPVGALWVSDAPTSAPEAGAAPGATKPAAAAPVAATAKPAIAAPGAATAAEAADIISLRVVAGPREDWFDADALRLLTTATYQVTAASNRTGLRLAGPALVRGRTGELPSEGMVTGALEVPHDGQPILLLADHPATGGYPVIAVVHSADIGRAAQLRPGQKVRFRWPEVARS
jgi:biotin-dependent carboxylase-like uncharacterized protein